LAERFDVTPQTIRRDINALCETGLLRRHYGGVSLPSATSNLPFVSRQIINQSAKLGIAAELAKRIPDGASVYLGIGTTVEFAARALADHQALKILTNNLNVASLLCNSPNIEVVVAGGQLRHNDHDLVGEETTHFFQQFRVDYGIIGSGSLELDHGLLDFDRREANISRAILDNARHRILLADRSKWDRPALALVAPFSHLDVLITDTLPEPARTRLPGTLTVVETEGADS
jgi:DeoR family glycerol-3-phosphate regulon repressor